MEEILLKVSEARVRLASFLLKLSTSVVKWSLTRLSVPCVVRSPSEL